MFFFFKQKTAYEMRISDWSSDVCSSDLGTTVDLAPGAAVLSLLQAIVRRGADAGPADREGAVVVRGRRRQRWWIGGWMRPHSSLDRRACRATTGIAGTHPVLIAAVGPVGGCHSPYLTVVGTAQADPILPLLPPGHWGPQDTLPADAQPHQ